ncbi:hypothetical protein LCGC14_2342470, partial [marine sediment metagenome]
RLLTDYQVVIMAVDHNQLAKVEACPPSMVGTTKIDEGMLASHIGLAKAMNKFDLRKVITFHSTIEKSRKFVKHHKEIAKWAGQSINNIELCTYVSGEMSAANRSKELNRLKSIKSGRGIIANARCLSEGADVPSLDAVAFIDPKKSQIDIIQAIGRAIRKSDGKRKSTIVVPIFIDKEYDSADKPSNSKFNVVWKILLALRSHDEVLADDLDKMRKDTAKNIHVSMKKATCGKVLVVTPSGDPNIGRHIEAQLLEHSTASWEFWYGLLEEYYNIKGNSLVPQEYVDRFNRRLGTWVQRQRCYKSRLSNDVIEKLKTVDFVWDAGDFRWEKKYKLGECKTDDP